MTTDYATQLSIIYRSDHPVDCLQAFIEQERESAHAAGRVAGLEEERARLDIPEVNDFIEGVRREAAHQRQRWGSDHDEGKTDADWFWLIGYLAGKALHKPEKRLHHLVTTAAALANWHAFTLGKTTMRPGIAHPTPTADIGTEQETPK